MATGYDYKDYYRGAAPAGQALNEVAPGMSITDKIRGLFGMLGVDQTPVDPQATGVGAKLRGGLGLAAMAVPTAVQADVRKAEPATPGFGAVAPAPAPAPAADTPAPSTFQTPAEQTMAMLSANDARANPAPGVTVTAGPNGPVTSYTGAAADMERSKDIAASLAPRPAGVGAVRKGGFRDRVATSQAGATPEGLGAFFGAGMRMKQAAGASAAAHALELKKLDGTTVTVPQGYMGDFTKDIPVLTTKGPGAGNITLTQPKIATTIRKGSDGKTYLIGADGKPVREATSAEIKSILAK